MKQLKTLDSSEPYKTVPLKQTLDRVLFDMKQNYVLGLFLLLPFSRQACIVRTVLHNTHNIELHYLEFFRKFAHYS